MEWPMCPMQSTDSNSEESCRASSPLSFRSVGSSSKPHDATDSHCPKSSSMRQWRLHHECPWALLWSGKRPSLLKQPHHPSTSIQLVTFWIANTEIPMTFLDHPTVLPTPKSTCVLCGIQSRAVQHLHKPVHITDLAKHLKSHEGLIAQASTCCHRLNLPLWIAVRPASAPLCCLTSALMLSTAYLQHGHGGIRQTTIQRKWKTQWPISWQGLNPKGHTSTCKPKSGYKGPSAAGSTSPITASSASNRGSIHSFFASAPSRSSSDARRLGQRLAA